MGDVPELSSKDGEAELQDLVGPHLDPSETCMCIAMWPVRIVVHW